MYKMKKLLLLLVIILGCLITLSAQSTTNFYSGTYSSLQKRAKISKKPYIVYFTASWCLPCQKMEIESFKNNEVATLLNSKFMSIKMNEGEEVSKELAVEYSVGGYPTFIIFNAEGKPIGRMDGYQTKDRFCTELKSYAQKLTKSGYTDFR